MMSEPSSKVDLQRILDSAKRLGVELDEEEAIQWLTAVSAAKGSSDVVVDTRTGVFGHTVTMLDFSPEELNYFRKIGRLVEFLDEPGVVETALALSGSAAQSKIQTYPGDCDYFERINIKAETQEEACRILGRLMREKALDTASGETFQLIEVKLGSYSQDVVRDGKNHTAGTPISWTFREIEAGVIKASDSQGNPVEIHWDDAAQDPGWCKLDWVVVDSIRGELANASNMLDVTWEKPDGEIVPLDGYSRPNRSPSSPNWPSMSPLMRLTITCDSWRKRCASTWARAPITAKPPSACITFSGSRAATRRRRLCVNCSTNRQLHSTRCGP
jgi:hypothetical protein